MKNENQITVNMENLTNEEREQLLKLVKKSNETLKKRWKAEVGQKYYYIDEYRNMIVGSFMGALKNYDAEDEVDKNLYKFGNYFKTEEEAEFELNKRLVYQELKDYALEHNEYELDWQDETQSKWYILCNYDAGLELLEYNCLWSCCDIGQIYFTSEQIAKEAVKTVGKVRIERYLFGVE